MDKNQGEKINKEISAKYRVIKSKLLRLEFDNLEINHKKGKL